MNYIHDFVDDDEFVEFLHLSIRCQRREWNIPYLGK